MLNRMCPKGGKKNASGEIIKGSNLENLIQNRPDFMQELTMLQWVGKQRGVRVIMLPKCHCKIAGA
jgi:hypothetical protein